MMVVKYLKAAILILAVLCSIVYVTIRQGPYSFVFAWVLNFTLMLCVFYYTHTFKPQLTSTYYNLKSWEAKGTVYKWFGVNVFRKFLVLIGWEKVNKAANPVKNDLEALKHLEFGTRKAEFGHLVVFIIVVIVNIWVAFYYGVAKSLSLFILNIIMNVYPIILQRYNRPRLRRAINVLQAKNSTH